MKELNTTDRKKEFKKQYKENILPFFENHGFQRHTKTSTRLFKHLENGLSVWIFFEYKTFGYGFYDMTISYFDEEIGNVNNDMYLVMANIKLPQIRMKYGFTDAVTQFLQEAEKIVISFIDSNKTHADILNNLDQFGKIARKNCLEVLKRKSR
ncbi:MAG: hypothetical protein ACPGSD_04640 [Flavobacteriales bacterium]